MGARLVREVIRTMPPTIKVADRLLVILIAVEVPDDTREGPYAEGKAVSGLDALCRDLGGMSRTGIRSAFQRLAAAGFEVRVPIAKGADHRPVYSSAGRLTRYQIPRFGPERETLF